MTTPPYDREVLVEDGDEKQNEVDCLPDYLEGSDDGSATIPR